MSIASDLGQELAPIIRRRLAEERVPGLAVGIVDAQGRQWSQGFGVLASDDDRPVDADTIFSVQSTSKLITSTAVLAAADRGLLSLDATLADLLPGFTVNSAFETAPERAITLRQLLQHTAGFTHEAPVGSNYRVGRESFAAHVASIRDTWLRFPVGHHHEYSNLGVDLAGTILQRVTGQQFAAAVHSLLFRPLEMGHSTFSPEAIRRASNRAKGSWRRAAESGSRLPVRIPMIPSGGLYASVNDLLKVVRLHQSDGASVMAATTRAQLEVLPDVVPDQREGYGLCVYVDRWDGIPVRHHGGSGFGFHAQLFWLPEHGIGGVVLTNSLDHDLQNELSRLIVRLAVGGRPVESMESAEVADAPTDAAGRYLGRLGDVVDVAVRDSSAVLTGDLGRAGDCFRFLAQGPSGATGYLQNLRDGTVRYRTEPAARVRLDIPAAFEGRYQAFMAGALVDAYEIRAGDGEPSIRVATRGASVDLALVAQAEGFRSSTGETLEIGPAGVTYANIPLHRATSVALPSP